MKKKIASFNGTLNNCTISFLRKLNLKDVTMDLNFREVKGKEIVTKLVLCCKIEEYAPLIKALDLNHVKYVKCYETDYDEFSIILLDYPVEFAISMQTFINK